MSPSLSAPRTSGRRGAGRWGRAPRLAARAGRPAARCRASRRPGGHAPAPLIAAAAARYVPALRVGGRRLAAEEQGVAAERGHEAGPLSRRPVRVPRDERVQERLLRRLAVLRLAPHGRARPVDDAAVTSWPRCAGRQWRKIASGRASASSSSSTWKALERRAAAPPARRPRPSRPRRRCRRRARRGRPRADRA